jgi:phage-related protein
MYRIKYKDVVPAVRIPLVFFLSAAGTEPVRDWLRALPDEDCRTIGQDLMRVQWRWPIGMPLCRSLGDGLWEVRTSLPSRRIARVIFVFHDGELVALHGFIKKSRKTPTVDLDLAVARRKELMR